MIRLDCRAAVRGARPHFLQHLLVDSADLAFRMAVRLRRTLMGICLGIIVFSFAVLAEKSEDLKDVASLRSVAAIEQALQVIISST